MLNLEFSKPLNFDNANEFPEAQQKREYELQEKAKIQPSRDFKGTRSRLALENFNKENETLYAAAEQMANTGVDAASIANTVQNYINMNTEQDQGVSLEVSAAEAQFEEAMRDNDNTYANAINSYLTADEAKVLADAEVLETWAQANLDRAKGTSRWYRWPMNVSRFLMPVFGTQALDQDVFPYGKKTPFELSSYTTRTRQRNYIDNFAKTHTTAEFKEFLDAVTEDMWANSDPATITQFIEDMRHPINKSNDIFGAFEIGTPILRSVNNAVRAAKASGNIKKAEQAAMESLDTDLQTELEELVTTSATKPFMNSETLSMSSRTADQIKDTLADRDAVSILNKYRAEGLIDDSEMKIFKDSAKFSFRQKYGKDLKEPVDINAVDIVQDDSGAYLTSITIGTGIDGKAAMDDAAALAYAKRLGLSDGTYRIAKMDGSGYYIQVFEPLQDKNLKVIGGSKDYANEVMNKATEEWKLRGLGRFFFGVVGVGEEAFKRDIQSTRFLTTMRSRLYDKYTKNFFSLSKDEHELFNAIYAKGVKANGGDGVWYTTDQLRDDFGASEKVIAAYQDFKKVSDIDYIAYNDLVHRELSRRGFKLYQGDIIGVEAGEAVLDKGLDHMSIKVGNNILNSKTSTAADIKERYLNKGFKLIQVSRRSQLDRDLNYNYMLLPSDQAASTLLPRFITNYAPGGRRTYTYGTMYVKQGRRVFSDGVEMNGFPKTLVAGTNRKELQQYSYEMNRAIDIFNRAVDENDIAWANRELTSANFKYVNIRNWDDLKDTMRSSENPTGLVDPRYKTKVLEDKEELVYDNQLPTMFNEIEEYDDALQDIINARASNTGHRYNVLEGVNGDDARILSVGDIFEKTIERAVYTNTLGDLHNWYGREFRKNFLQYIDTTHGYNPSMYSDKELIRSAPLRKLADVPKEDRDGLRAAMNMQQHYLRIANTPTAWDKSIERTMKGIARTLGDKVPFLYRDSKALDKLAKTDPAKFARGIGFNHVFGWWNTAQFWKQALGIVTTASVHPITASRAIAAYPFVRLAYAFKDSKNLFYKFSNLVTKAVGISSKEFNDFIDYMDWYGSLEGTKMLVGMDTGHINMIRNSKLLRSQYFFANEGTNANYVIADLTAFLEKKGSSYKDIAAYADTLYGHMTKASESAFQAGQIASKFPVAVMAQWLTYPTRMIELMIDGKLTKAQKARILAGQMAAWGVAGTFGDDKAELNMYDYMVKNDMPPEIASQISVGLLTDLGREYGVEISEGLNLWELIKNELFLYDKVTGELRMPNIPAVSAFGQVGSIYRAIKDVVAPATDEMTLYLWLKKRATDKYLNTGTKNILKSFMAYRGNLWWNTNQDIVKEDSDLRAAVLQLIGFNPVESKEQAYIYSALEDYNGVVDEMFEDLQEQIRDYNSMLDKGNWEDPVRKDEILANMRAKYTMDLQAYLRELGEAYPDSQAQMLLSNKLINALQGPENVLDKGREKLYDSAGPSIQRIIRDFTKGEYNVVE